MLNILIIALLDLLGGEMTMSARVHQGQVLTTGFGISMLGLVALSLEAGDRMPALGSIGVNSIVLIGVYLVAMRLVFKYEKRRAAEFVGAVEDTLQTDMSAARAGLL